MVNISTIFSSINEHKPPPSWLAFVWSKFSIAKYAFNSWLIMRERLLTKDRMQTFLMHINQTCLLCGGAFETHQHLFCDCPFSRTILNDCPINVTTSWNDICSGRVLTVCMDSIRTNIAYLFVSVAFYHIWMERNLRLHNSGQYTQPPIISRMIKDVLRNRLISCDSFIKAARQDVSLHSFIF